MEYAISKIFGREVIDSRGNPTVEAELTLADGSMGRATVPSGASKGEHEALELRDGDPKRFLGKGVRKAVDKINQVIPKVLVNRKFEDVRAVDKALFEIDNSQQKSSLGANSMLAVSMAFAHAASLSKKVPLYLLLNEWMGLSERDCKLPVPFMNVLNGGMHANNGLSIQEFMIVPHGLSSFSESLRAGCEVFQTLKKYLEEKHLSTGVGDEGGFAPVLRNNEEALQIISMAIEKAGYKLGSQISLALDVASSSFYSKDKKGYELEKNKFIDSNEMIYFFEGLIEKYPIISIEDGLDENDWDGWKKLTEKVGSKVQLVGDDLFVTDKARVEKGIQAKVANSVLIKVNQIGTLSETFDTMAKCRQAKYKSIVSHRSGETEDITIAHLAVGSGCGQIKTGSVSRGERTAKYNELLRIAENTALPFAK
jgi:enolase